ncbi:hypothetical protein DdX_22471 [Ditylenchus destructor]|uniref:Uncharacterized protein n=1 Tax=Ditylenchus destructor TaxID=166010 RepID=A0AAD4MHX2_9BILA|nr:hypothetical protein DdX_22471 [Ditylenchus destructor]
MNSRPTSSSSHILTDITNARKKRKESTIVDFTKCVFHIAFDSENHTSRMIIRNLEDMAATSIRTWLTLMAIFDYCVDVALANAHSVGQRPTQTEVTINSDSLEREVHISYFAVSNESADVIYSHLCRAKFKSDIGARQILKLPFTIKIVTSE